MMKDKNSSSILLAVMMIASMFSMVPVTASADETKTVYVGFISTWHSNENESLTGWQVHYWGGSTTADANLTRMPGISKQQSVGNDYWNNTAQTFYMYKVEVPADATGFKVRNGNTWVGSDGVLTNYNAAYIFEYDGNNNAFYDNYAESSESTEPTNPNPTDPQPITTNFDYKTVYAVGNGEGNWLNGEIWNPAAEANKMTQVVENVWKITYGYEDVPVGYERLVKFAIDGVWDHNFGGNFEAFGSWSNADHNGSNIKFGTDDYCTVTITLDLSNFDIATKTGAKFKIDYIEDVEVALAPTGYGTYYNGQCEVTLPVGVAAYVLNDDTPTYEKIADGDGDGTNVKKTVPAGVAVLLYSASSPVNLGLSTTITDSRTFDYNKLHGSDVATTTTGGGDGAKYYKLTYSNNDDNFGWYWEANEGAAFTSPAHKAWLALPATGARAFFDLPGDDFTGISTIENRQQNADNVWYDLNGRRINAPKTKGIYVKDGRKLVIK